MDRTMSITGIGKLKVSPDMVWVLMYVKGFKESYQDAMNMSEFCSKSIVASLRGLGFKDSDVKTTDFSIDAKYEKNPRTNVSSNRIVGYEFNQELKVEFLRDAKTIDEVLDALSKNETKPEIRLEFTLADEEASRATLIADAMRDSKNKAEVLANAAGVKLGNIVKIDYGWEMCRNFVEPIGLYGGPDKRIANFNFEPDDIELEDQVKVVWEIK